MKYKDKRRLIVGISLFLLLGIYLFKNLSANVRVFGFIAGIVIFYLIDHMFEIKFELRHYIYMVIILAFGILFSPLYFLVESYDKLLHFLMPIFGSILILYIVNKQKLSIQWKLLITFMFIISFLTIHEIGEYLIDLFFNLKLQGVYIRDISGIDKMNLILSKHDDTMIDLIFGLAGSLMFTLGKSFEYFCNSLKRK